MKKSTIIVFALICISFTGLSQLRVNSSGQVGVGTTTPNEQFQIGDRWTFHNGGSKIIAYNHKYSGGAKRIVSDEASNITLDQYGHIYLKTAPYGSSGTTISWTTAMKIFNGTYAKVQYPGWVGIGTTPTTAYRLYVWGTVRAVAYSTVSDLRVKENINDLSSEVSDLKKLRGVSYTLSHQKLNSFLADSSDNGISSDSLKNAEQIIQYGFLAQEMKKVFPELVDEDQNGLLAIKYSPLIPLLVEAYKSQQQQIEELQAAINTSSNLKGVPATSTSEDLQLPESESSTLYQNSPNPYTNETTIGYNLNENVGSATLFIYNMTGKQLRSYNIIERGASNITIEGGNLSAGMYMYSLVADGCLIGTKQMLLTD